MLPACSAATAEALPPGWRWAGLIAIPACLLAVSWGASPWWLCWFCDLTLIATWFGLLLPSRRLLSATLPASLSINAMWTVDACTTLAGVPLSGLTAYVIDPAVPLYARIATWFHVVHPVALLLVVRRLGYHRQGLLLALAWMGGALFVLRLAVQLGLLPEEVNPNFVRPLASWRLPGWLPAWTYNGLQFAVLAIGLLLPVHLLLLRLWPQPLARRPASSAS
ncbi:MAG: hypothetical protein J0M02_13395 [Planctomycetes bacterium]|nr:hypothetical protein [Planctomycetota bacterium]